jgi:hypothetical protein
MIPSTAFDELLKELREKPLTKNNYRTTAGKGMTQAFGVVNKRCQPPDYSRQCWLRPKLYKLLLDFAKEYVHIPFNAITVNCNYQAAPHYDKNNSGLSLLVAFGDYEGGELEIHEEGEKKGKYNIRHTPLIEDFSKLLHSVKDFQGERYSLVFYQFEHKRWKVNLPPPSVKEVEGKLVFFRGDEECYGLPHPLKKKVAP